jgi:hypothetical protein
VELGVQYTPARHHVTTLSATSSRRNPETLAMSEVLAYPRTMFHPCTCGLCGGAIAFAAALIGYDGARSLLGRGREGDDRGRLLHLHRHASILD